MTHTRESLIAFTDRVAAAFEAKLIRAPVHLCGGNEDQLIDIFRDVRPGDWVFSTWRSAYHALLKGIPEEWVWNEIVAGRSMYLMSREHRFFCSSIVGGILPIALGMAAGIKEEGAAGRVWTFVGDMTAETGLFHEFQRFAVGHGLPVTVVVEDNGFSTNTPTERSWGIKKRPLERREYFYRRTRPHVGTGQRVSF